MRIVSDGYPLIFGSVALSVVFAGTGWALGSTWTAWVITGMGVLAVAFFVYFFRDPERQIPDDPAVIVSGADGLIRAVEPVAEPNYLQADTIRISIFLNPFDVHVNRAPLGGEVAALAYTPGKHLLTMNNASSEHNEHSSIYIQGTETDCLVKQIVGPVVRRVVYWLEGNQVIARGDRIGMMKFGSRMDIYLRAADVDVTIKKGDRVRAGETVIARCRKA